MVLWTGTSPQDKEELRMASEQPQPLWPGRSLHGLCGLAASGLATIFVWQQPLAWPRPLWPGHSLWPGHNLCGLATAWAVRGKSEARGIHTHTHAHTPKIGCGRTNINEVDGGGTNNWPTDRRPRNHATLCAP